MAKAVSGQPPEIQEAIFTKAPGLKNKIAQLKSGATDDFWCQS
jgi:hypothetical protein